MPARGLNPVHPRSQLSWTPWRWAGVGVCCSRNRTGCGGRPADAWFLPGAAREEPPAGVAADTTILISSAARPRDDGEENVRLILDSLRSVRLACGLNGSRAVVIFDGLRGKPGVTASMRTRYASKVRRARAALPAEVDVLVAEEWLHQANSMRCALQLRARAAPRRPTPLLFVIQDDTRVVGDVDSALVHRLLTARGSGVEYVRMSSTDDCVNPRTRVLWPSHAPCTAHASSPLLHRTDRWVDRPHFATREHYERRLFEWLPLDAKATPEQLLDQRSRRDRDWPLWVYGRRGAMLRDLHWPLEVDGKLRSKEEWLPLKRSGRLNVSAAYAHSYLIHAYRGTSQDVGAKQIAARAFREHNPFNMLAEDGLTRADA